MAILTLEQIYELSFDALTRCGASKEQAGPTAVSIKDAEADGIRNVGLKYLPIYLGHLLHGKVLGKAEPTIVNQSGSAIQVDGGLGFCHPAFVMALDPFAEMAKQQGIAILTMRRSYSAGVLGWFNQLLANEGLISFAFANAPSSVAPFGGKKKFFGTNPLSFGVPRANHPPIIIDLSTSATAKVNVKAAAASGTPIPQHWAIDPEGNPTTDAGQGLAGALSPLGGAKGFGLGLMVEIMAAGLTGSNWAFQASQFADNEGGPPDVGQSFIAIEPMAVGGDALSARLEEMLGVLTSQEGVRLPGSRRHEFRAEAEANGVEVPDDLIAKIEQFEE